MRVGPLPCFMFDSHNHLHRLPDPLGVIGRMREVGITGCVVNGTCEGDWGEVAGLAEERADFVRPAFGVHPWQAAGVNAGWMMDLEGWRDAFPAGSIGECGLDGWVRGPSLEVQRAVCLPQLALARERELPGTVHALKAWEPLFAALKEEPPPERGFLLHSFGGSEDLVKRLADLGAWFSFSGYFLQTRKAKVLEAYRAVPRERLLVETDAPDMLPPEEFRIEVLPEKVNHPANLVRIVAGLAEALGMEAGELGQLTEANARRFFGAGGEFPTANGRE
ncbi:MAG: TatD-related deoxyribonuclease [Akkermansiaceae bacterium]|nr:TatD-related deoxyribonuclease [Akkermansiaceae bacterium]